MIEYLLGKGRDVRVYDPHIRIEGIFSSNKSYIVNAQPHIGKLLSVDVDGVIELNGRRFLLSLRRRTRRW